MGKKTLYLECYSGISGDMTVAGGSIAYVDNTHKLAVTGGTIAELVVKEADYAPVNGTTATITGGTVTTINAVAKIDNAYYATLADAINAAEEGDNVALLADHEGTVVIPAGIKLDLNGKTIKGNIVGTVAMNNGTWITPDKDYVMAGPNAEYYKTTDAVLTMDATGNIVVEDGTLTLAQSWWTLKGQTLTIAEGAKFIIPEGMSLNVLSTVVVNGDVEVKGSVNLYDAEATITADAGLNVVTTVEDAKVEYVAGVYTVHVHSWGKATCTEPAKCECGDTKGEALGHDSKYVDNGDGTHDYVCSVCGTPEVDNEAHIYDDDKDTTCNVCPAERVVEDEIKNFATSLGGDIGFKMYFTLTEETLADANAYVSFITNGEEIERQYMTEAGAPDKDGEYAFMCGVAAAQMADEITVQLVYGDGTKGATGTYTVKQYVEQRLQNPAASAEEKALLKAMLNYGAYAQTFFEYNDGDLANNVDGVELPDLNAVTADKISQSNVQTGAATGIAIKGYSALLEDETTFKFVFALADGADIADYTFTYTDGTAAPVALEAKKAADGTYCVYIEDIAAALLDQRYTLTVTNTDGSSYSLTTSVLCYVKSVINNSNNTEAKINMAKALYLYNQAANAYFDK